MLGLSPQVKVTRCWRKRESKASPQGVRPLGSRETGGGGLCGQRMGAAPADTGERSEHAERPTRGGASHSDGPARAPGPLSVESRKARYVHS